MGRLATVVQRILGAPVSSSPVSADAMMVACFCGIVFEADQDALVCPVCGDAIATAVDWASTYPVTRETDDHDLLVVETTDRMGRLVDLRIADIDDESLAT